MTENSTKGPKKWKLIRPKIALRLDKKICYALGITLGN